ncbi:hypothetical protein JCM6882_003704 [Rhodosporidiobolus microsporus]
MTSPLHLLLSLIVGAVFLLSLLALRLFHVLDRTHSRPTRPRRPPTDEAVLAVFLGSGGHTAEMTRLTAHLDFRQRFTKRVWIVSSGDGMSEAKALEMEKRIGGGEFRILRIPRARKVYQSYLTSPFTTLYTLAFTLWHIAVKPLFFPLFPPSSSSPSTARRRVFADLILLNGPGSCVPIAVSAFLPRLLSLPSPSLVYIESLARTRRLSLSAKLVRPLVDRFFVQWEALREELLMGKQADGGGKKRWKLLADVECEGWLV